MAKHRNNPNFAFWKMIKEGYDHFEASHQEPKVAVCEKRYVFDPAQPENASRPLSFNATGKCPVYQLDPTIASAVLDQQRHEQVQMAEYIARGVATVPARTGIDGGMNPVFAAKLNSHNEFDNNGRTYQVAGNTLAPGALPRTAAPPAAPAEAPPAAAEPASEPVVLASVPMPHPAPQPKVGEAPQQPTTIAGLLGNLFGGDQAEAKPSTPASDSTTVGLRGSNTDQAKPSRASIIRTAATPAPQLKPREAEPAKPAAVADSTPAPKPNTKQASAVPVDKQDAPRSGDQEMRTAFSAPPASNSGLLAGAQPVVPVGSFDSRWSGLR
jgi:hypothetical protein